MDIYVLDKDSIIDNVSQINHNINNIDDIENRINKKRQDIYSLYVRLEKKKYLNLGDSIDNLKFQLQLITHENSYLKNTKDLFINKVSSALFDIGENVIMVVSSMDDINLEYQDRNEKDNDNNHSHDVVGGLRKYGFRKHRITWIKRHALLVFGTPNC